MSGALTGTLFQFDAASLVNSCWCFGRALLCLIPASGFSWIGPRVGRRAHPPLSDAAPNRANEHAAELRRVPTELLRDPSKHRRTQIIYSSPQLASPRDPTKLRRTQLCITPELPYTPLSYATPNRATLHPAELRRTLLIYLAPPLSFAAPPLSYLGPHWATMHPTELPGTLLSYAAYPRYAAERKYENVVSCTLI